MEIKYVGGFLMEEIEHLYDDDTDTMHINFGKYEASISEEKYPGVIYRYSLNTGSLVGITVHNYTGQDTLY